jgi:hypothetical protein
MNSPNAQGNPVTASEHVRQPRLSPLPVNCELGTSATTGSPWNPSVPLSYLMLSSSGCLSSMWCELKDPPALVSVLVCLMVSGQY